MNRMRHSRLHQVQEDSLIKSLLYTGEKGDDDEDGDDDDDNNKYYN